MTNKTVSLNDLNTADEDVLAQKLQVSARVAKRIISLRPYQSVEQLNKIWGIDPDVLKRIVSLISGAPHEIVSDLTVKEVPALHQIVSPFTSNCVSSRRMGI
jgi:hypothetical protein